MDSFVHDSLDVNTASVISVSAVSSRHGLIDGLDSVSHGELVHDLLRRLLEVNLPGVVSFSIGDFHHTAVLLLCGVVEDVLQRHTVQHSGAYKTCYMLKQHVFKCIFKCKVCFNVNVLEMKPFLAYTSCRQVYWT